MRAFRSFAAIAIGAAAIAAGCGSDDNEEEPAAAASGGGDSAELQPVKLVSIPVLQIAPAVVAEKEGIMAEHGLKLEFTPAASGTQIVAAVSSGQADVGASMSPMSTLSAA